MTEQEWVWRPARTAASEFSCLHGPQPDLLSALLTSAWSPGLPPAAHVLLTWTAGEDVVLLVNDPRRLELLGMSHGRS